MRKHLVPLLAWVLLSWNNPALPSGCWRPSRQDILSTTNLKTWQLATSINYAVGSNWVKLTNVPSRQFYKVRLVK